MNNLYFLVFVLGVIILPTIAESRSMGGYLGDGEQLHRKCPSKDELMQLKEPLKISPNSMKPWYVQAWTKSNWTGKCFTLRIHLVGVFIKLSLVELEEDKPKTRRDLNVGLTNAFLPQYIRGRDGSVNFLFETDCTNYLFFVNFKPNTDKSDCHVRAFFMTHTRQKAYPDKMEEGLKKLKDLFDVQLKMNKIDQDPETCKQLEEAN